MLRDSIVQLLGAKGKIDHAVLTAISYTRDVSTRRGLRADEECFGAQGVTDFPSTLDCAAIRQAATQALRRG